MTTQGTGEEWRRMDTGGAGFATEASQAAVRAARENIPHLRMRDVEVRLVDGRGRPLAGTPVRVAQTRNAFLVGERLWDLDAMYRHGQGETDRARYWKQRYTDVFNAANALCYWTERPRNDAAKMEDFQGEPRLDVFAATVDWAHAAGCTVKGHPLFWSIPKAVPDWVMRYDYPTQLKFLEVRIRNLVARFKGTVRLWDAVNEPLWEPTFKNLARRQWPHLDPIEEIAEYIALVIGWARAEDPDACLLVNDYGLEGDPDGYQPIAADGSRVTAQRQRGRFLQMIAALRERGAAPNAIGLQSHTGGWLGHDAQAALYAEMSAGGLPIHITEFWANRDALPAGEYTPEEMSALHAQYVGDYLTVAFGHPAVDAFFFWGFMLDAITWDDKSGHELTPTYTRVQSLLRDEWLTREALTTDRDGVLRFRGYFGDYALRYPVPNGPDAGLRFSVTREQTGVVELTAGLACSG